jgi:cell division septum initiation protein DivIVA
MSTNQAAIEDLIDELYDILEKGWSLPFSSGKCFIDVEEVKQILDEIREAIPTEIRKAKAIVADRVQIINEANNEAEAIRREADEKAKIMTGQEEVVRRAKAEADDIRADAKAKSMEMITAARAYVDDMMRRSDESLATALAELRKTRQSIQAKQQKQ